MNPLQYLPVVGTIYRAITGDVIPEALRRAGSMVVSGLLGGPIGLGLNIATTIAEKVSGIDPETVIAEHLKTVPQGVARPADVTGGDPAPAQSAQVAWTPAQLEAYGVRQDVSGVLRLGDIQGADVLNALQLVRLDRAAAVYAANQAMAGTLQVPSA